LFGDSIEDSLGDSCLSLLLVELEVSEPLLSLGVLEDNALVSSLGNGLSHGLVLLLDLCSGGGLSDLGVDFFIEGLKVGNLGGVEGLLPSGELGGVSLFLLLLQEVHVPLDVVAENVISVLFGNPGSG